MTGKEALEELKFQVGNITYYTHDLQMTTSKVRDSGLFEIIEKELKEYNRHKSIEELIELLSDAYDDGLPIYSSEGNGKIMCVKDWHIAWIEDLRWLAVEYKKNKKFNGIHSIEGYGRTFALTKEELEKK